MFEQAYNKIKSTKIYDFLMFIANGDYNSANNVINKINIKNPCAFEVSKNELASYLFETFNTFENYVDFIKYLREKDNKLAEAVIETQIFDSIKW